MKPAGLFRIPVSRSPAVYIFQQPYLASVVHVEFTSVLAIISTEENLVVEDRKTTGARSPGLVSGNDAPVDVCDNLDSVAVIPEEFCA